MTPMLAHVIDGVSRRGPKSRQGFAGDYRAPTKDGRMCMLRNTRQDYSEPSEL